MLITVSGGYLDYFKEILLEQHKVFRLVGYEKTKIKIVEQEEYSIKFEVSGPLTIGDISSITNGDFRFYTTEAENDPLVEIEKVIKELFDTCIYQADALRRIEPELSKVFNSFAKSIKKKPEEWVKMLEYYTLGDRSLFAEEEINKNYLELFNTLKSSSMIILPTMSLLEFYRHEYKLPEIEILKNPEDLFYIGYISEGYLSVPWRNLIIALNLSLCVEDQETSKILLKIQP